MILKEGENGATMINSDKRAPMASAPMKYDAEGRVDWGNMWDSFCALALDGGPPHRETFLGRPASVTQDAAYAAAAGEIIRAIAAVSGLQAALARPGWIAVQCHSPAMASWLSAAIVAENVEAQAEDATLLVPVGADFRLEKEIKNVVTAVAKTTHYWQNHLPAEVRIALVWQQRALRLCNRLTGWFTISPNSIGA